MEDRQQNRIVLAVHPSYFREGLVDEVVKGKIPEEMTVACRIKLFWPWLFQHSVDNGSVRRATNEAEAASMCSRGLAEMCITTLASAGQNALYICGYFSDEEISRLKAKARRRRRKTVAKKRQ